MAELKNAELEIFSLFEMTPDLVCIASKDGFFKKINPAVINKLEYTKEELYSISFSASLLFVTSFAIANTNSLSGKYIEVHSSQTISPPLVI